MLSNTFRLYLLSNHKTSDVLQEDKRDLPLRTKLNKVGALHRALAEQYAIVCYDTDWVAIKLSKAGNQRGTITLLEFVETRTVKHACQDVVHVEGFLVIDRNDAVELICIEERFLWPISVVLVFSEVVLDAEIRYD